MVNAEELYRVIADYTQVGFMQAVKAYEPTQDRIRKSEVRKWLKINLINEKKFDALCDKGLIRAFRTGTARNSPLCYSKKEIKQAMATAGLLRIIVRQELENLNIQQ